MTDDWDFYFCTVDNKAASIFVDLGVAVDAPISGYVQMGYVRVYMKKPRPDGLSSQEEFESLKSIEDTLESVLTLDRNVTYVGRNTSDGCRDFYYYLKEDVDWGPLLSEALQSFPEYAYEKGMRNDVEWKTYFQFLFPSDEDRERIENRRTCDALKRNGDTLEKKREIDHWVYFCNEQDAVEFSQYAFRLGFQMRGRLSPREPEESFGVQIFRVDIPSYDEIDSITLPLFRLARKCGGEYDGWETQVVL